MGDDVQRLRDELAAAHRNRAMIYAHVYEVLSERFGAGAAEAVLKEAIYRRGRELGRRFAPWAPADMRGLCAAFLDFVPDRGRLFEPEVERCDEGGVDIYMRRCPLKEAWLEAGLAPERIEVLCRIAGVVDNGTFEAAGFAFAAETWRAGEPGCCHLHIRPATAAQT